MTTSQAHDKSACTGRSTMPETTWQLNVLFRIADGTDGLQVKSAKTDSLPICPKQSGPKRLYLEGRSVDEFAN